MKKVLLYLASNSPFYTNLYPSIKRGFEEAGCVVEGGPNLLESEALLKKIETFQPDFVFEMNRVKSEIENFPKNVIHVCWLVDFWGRRSEELIGSDILYVWSMTWIEKFKEIGIQNVHYLAPATDAKIYENNNRKKNHEFVFLGHMSKQWTNQELHRKIGRIGNQELFFKDILSYVREYVLTPNMQKPLIDILKNYGIVLADNLDKPLLYDIFSRAFRQIRREHFIDIFTNKVSIYGSKNWLLYDKYRNSYKGYIEKPQLLSAIIQSSKILLHDHYDPHFRTFDAMACGTLVVTAKEKINMDSPWMKLGLIDKEDYISVDINSKLSNKNDFLNQRYYKDIIKNAQEKVLLKHLWVHRAEQILHDVKGIEIFKDALIKGYSHE